MRWVVVVGLLVAVTGCVRLNPGFGSETDEAEDAGGGSTEPEPTGVLETTAGEGTGGLTSGNSSESTASLSSGVDSGPSDPPPAGYVCGVDQYDILIGPPPPECTADDLGAPIPVTINGDCMSIHAEGSALVASRANGCEVDSCAVTGDGELTLSTEYIHLGDALEIGNASVCRYVWAHGYPIVGNGDGLCSWDALAIWRPNGALDLAVGNGLPDDGFPNAVARDGGSDIAVSSAILDGPTICGSSRGACARAGWRSFSFADMDLPALPDGFPVEASLDGQALSVVNNGLQFDLSCNRFGRWGVVPKGREAVLTDQ